MVIYYNPIYYGREFYPEEDNEETFIEVIMIEKIAGMRLTDSWVGIAGEDLKKFDFCYVGLDGSFYKASAASASTMPGLVLAEDNIIKSNKGKFIRGGIIENSIWSFITGKQVHAGIVPGTLTQDFPNSGQQLQIVGIAMASNQIDFNPNIMLIEVA